MFCTTPRSRCFWRARSSSGTPSSASCRICRPIWWCRRTMRRSSICAKSMPCAARPDGCARRSRARSPDRSATSPPMTASRRAPIFRLSRASTACRCRTRSRSRTKQRCARCSNWCRCRSCSRAMAAGAGRAPSWSRGIEAGIAAYHRITGASQVTKLWKEQNKLHRLSDLLQPRSRAVLAPAIYRRRPRQALGRVPRRQGAGRGQRRAARRHRPGHGGEDHPPPGDGRDRRASWSRRSIFPASSASISCSSTPRASPG